MFFPLIIYFSTLSRVPRLPVPIPVTYLSPFTSSTIPLLFLRYQLFLVPRSISKTSDSVYKFISGPLSLFVVHVLDVHLIGSGVHVRGYLSTDLNNPKPSLCNAARQSAISTANLHPCSTSFRLQKLVGHTYFLPSIHTRYSRVPPKHLENLGIRNNAQSSSPVLFLALGSTLPHPIGEALLIA